jgi:hypothetical protein
VAYTFGYDLLRTRLTAEPTDDARWRAYERWIGT